MNSQVKSDFDKASDISFAKHVLSIMLDAIEGALFDDKPSVELINKAHKLSISTNAPAIVTNALYQLTCVDLKEIGFNGRWAIIHPGLINDAREAIKILLNELPKNTETLIDFIQSNSIQIDRR